MRGFAKVSLLLFVGALIAAAELNITVSSVLSMIRGMAGNAVAARHSGAHDADWSTHWSSSEPYLRHTSGTPNKIVLFLHTWSANYTQAASFPALKAIGDAVVVSPNFNGSNKTPEALASDDAIARIEAVVAEVKEKTHLKRVLVIAASGGTIPAIKLMARNPGMIQIASLWVPIYDLAELYNETSANDLKADMVSVFGHTPSGLDDADYRVRSPRSYISSIVGPTRVYINTGSTDTQTPKHHGEKIRDELSENCTDCQVFYREWKIGHQFSAAEIAYAIQQLSGEF